MDKEKVNKRDAAMQVVNNPKSTPFAVQVAQRELNRLGRRADAYNRVNNPEKYAAKLEKQAAYYREKAKTKK